jgi:glycosyltransferase involved in cell wall biosynthesis
MKIVHIITRLILGGAQENTLITCRESAARGHSVTLITGPAIGPEGDLFGQTKDQGYEVIVVDSLRRQINPFHDLPAYFQIKKHLQRIMPDIVHTHSAKAGILGRFAADVIKPRPKVVHTIHGLAFHPYQSELVNRFYIAIERATAKRTDAFISVADAMTQKALAAGIGTADDYTTAYSAIDQQSYLQPPDSQQIADFRRKHQISNQATVLVTIARLFELKGHEYIIESAKRLAADFPNCIWLFVGSGNLADTIKSDIQAAGLSDRFRFTGLLPTDQIPLAIHASDILVHCSLREGLARVLPQAMLCGKPVVSFDIDGAAEVVNSDTGFLTEPKDIDALTSACAELIRSPQLRDTLARAARESVTEKFAPQTMTDTIEEVYKDLLTDK